jgi:hypothetical protein
MITIFENFKYQQDIETIIQEIKELLNSKNMFPRNKWILTDNVKLYIRKSKRFIENEMRDFLDISSVEVEPKGEKLFTNLLDRIEKEFSDKNIFVESILNDRLYEFLLKRGYLKTNDEFDKNLYKLK